MKRNSSRRISTVSSAASDSRLSVDQTPWTLLLRVHSASDLEFATSRDSYCKLYVGKTPVSRASNALLTKLLSAQSDPNSAQSEHRMYHTGVYRSPHPSCATWDEKFQLPLLDTNEVLSIRVKSKQALYSPAVGSCAIHLKQLVIGRTIEQSFPLFKEKTKVGTIRLQMCMQARSMSWRKQPSSSPHEPDPDPDPVIAPEYHRHVPVSDAVRSTPSNVAMISPQPTPEYQHQRQVPLNTAVISTPQQVAMIPSQQQQPPPSTGNHQHLAPPQFPPQAQPNKRTETTLNHYGRPLPVPLTHDQLQRLHQLAREEESLLQRLSQIRSEMAALRSWSDDESESAGVDDTNEAQYRMNSHPIAQVAMAVPVSVPPIAPPVDVARAPEPVAIASMQPDDIEEATGATTSSVPTLDHVLEAGAAIGKIVSSENDDTGQTISDALEAGKTLMPFVRFLGEQAQRASAKLAQRHQIAAESAPGSSTPTLEPNGTTQQEARIRFFV